ncbi:MAG TPA: wax ester/triacylglycerol synthase domain-containing protein [Baekduia sp.]|nr:wax ester/triacylglycerol synthase domain-containing protein [Baekduia sp.]
MKSSQRVAPLDRVFLDLDTAVTPQQVGWIIRFEGAAPTLDELRAHIGSRLTELPRFKCSVRRPPVYLGLPVWTPDRRFALERHVLAVKTDGRDLTAVAGELLTQRLDRSEPLWRLWLIDDLDDGFAVVGHGHHALIDGLAASQVAQLLLDPIGSRPPVMGQGPRRSTARRMLRRGAGELLRRGRPTSLTGGGGRERRLGVAETDLRRARTTARDYGATANDALLAAAAIAIGDELRRRGEPVTQIKALMPVRLREDDRRRSQGNAIAPTAVELPIGCEDASDLLGTIARRSAMSRGLADSGVIALLARIGGLVPTPLRGLVTRFVYRFLRFDVIVSNIPGPRTDVHLLGRVARSFHPFVPVTQGQGFAIGAMTYRGRMFLGVNADPGALPDPQAFADSLQAAFETLAQRTSR